MTGPGAAHRREVLKALAAGGLALASPSLRATTADRKGDLDILRRALALHPGLHRYNTPRQIEAALARLEPRFLAASDTATAYLALSEFLATLRCGHTYANFFNQRKAIAADLFDRRTRLPFEFLWIDGRMVITRWRDASTTIPPGTIVESIDGLPAPRLLDRLMPYARADGGNDGKRRSLLSMQGTDSIEYFDVFQGLLHPPRGSAWQLRVITPDGKRRALDAPLVTLAERRAARPVREPGAPVWSWQMTPESVAILTMPTWAAYSFDWKDWQPWLADRLASLDGARALIVDLRDNEGGEDCGDEILARLTNTDLRFDADLQRLRFQTTPPDLDPYLDTWDPSFHRLGEGAAPLADGFYARPGAEDLSLIRPQSPRIRVPVAALIGPVNSSATFQFTQRAQSTGLIRLFGSETGGNRRGINGGCFFFVRLPASGIEFDLPLIGYFPRHPQPDAGLVPDVRVRLSARDVARGHDPTLEAALAWARRAAFHGASAGAGS